MSLVLVALVVACSDKATLNEVDVLGNGAPGLGGAGGSDRKDAGEGAAPASDGTDGANPEGRDSGASVDSSFEQDARPLVALRFYVLDTVPNQPHAAPRGGVLIEETEVDLASSDGSVLVGVSTIHDAGTDELGAEVFRWTEATGVVGIGFLPGDAGRTSFYAPWTSQAGSLSSNGSIIFGTGANGPFRWKAGTGLTALGTDWAKDSTLDEVYGSSDGRVAIGSARLATPSEVLALWEEPTGWTVLPQPKSGYDANAGGVVSPTGEVYLGSGDDMFRWSRASGLVEYPKPPGYISCAGDPTRANSAVSVGVCYVDADGSSEQSFRLTETGATGLGFLPNDTKNVPSLVNDDGSVVIGHAVEPGGGVTPPYRVFRWTEVTGMVLFDLPNGDHSFRETGMSDDGKVAIGNVDLPAQQAYRWSAVEGFVGLGFLPGYQSSHVDVVSRDGTLFAGTASSAGGGAEPVLWDALGIRSIRAEVAAAGASLADLSFLSVDRIWSGDSIVVQGTLERHADRDAGKPMTRHAWVAILQPRK